MCELLQDISDVLGVENNSSQIEYCGRFAPSPSGPLHLGNIRTAFLSWLRARLEGGKWMLRIDDLDSLRIRSGAIEKIQYDLRWLGLYWDGPIIYQSKRIPLYETVLSDLKSKNKLYICKCSRKALSKLNRTSKEFIYPGICRDLGLQLNSKQGKSTSLRLRVGKDFSETCGDIVVRRADGFIAYHLATVVDDLSLGINEVVRGNDLAPAKVAQLAIIDALNQRKLRYRHVPILLDEKGEKLSKRNADKGLDAFISQGITPSEVIGFLASSVGLAPVGSSLSAVELLTDFISRNRSINHIFND